MCRKGVTDELIKAARRVASGVKGPNHKKTENDLLKMLKAHEVDVEASRSGQPLHSLDLAKSIVGIRLEKSAAPTPVRMPREDLGPDPFAAMPPLRPLRGMQREAEGRDERNQRTDAYRSRSRESSTNRFSRQPTKSGIFGRESLAIFDPEKMKPSSLAQMKLSMWKQLKTEELKSLVTLPPSNAFEEMIQWTEKGKLWKYPIDNEAGLDEEKKVPFYDHVFLEDWLQGAPEKGPVRQFLEVMLISLSKNPYITVERKKETFEWFSRYFEAKRDILSRAGVVGYNQTLPKETASNSLTE